MNTFAIFALLAAGNLLAGTNSESDATVDAWASLFESLSIGDSLEKLLETREGLVNDSLDASPEPDRNAERQQLRELLADFPITDLKFMGYYEIDKQKISELVYAFTGNVAMVNQLRKPYVGALLKVFGEAYTVSESNQKLPLQEKVVIPVVRWDKGTFVVHATIPPESSAAIEAPSGFALRMLSKQQELKSEFVLPHAEKVDFEDLAKLGIQRKTLDGQSPPDVVPNK